MFFVWINAFSHGELKQRFIVYAGCLFIGAFVYFIENKFDF